MKQERLFLNVPFATSEFLFRSSDITTSYGTLSISGDPSISRNLYLLKYISDAKCLSELMITIQLAGINATTRRLIDGVYSYIKNITLRYSRDYPEKFNELINGKFEMFIELLKLEDGAKSLQDCKRIEYLQFFYKFKSAENKELSRVNKIPKFLYDDIMTLLLFNEVDGNILI